ncbi:acyl-homoserine-lactone synthase [Bradyrhizobium sp. BWA-3-5]|uniref:acyl-homoserine-lactone synthase n=1 Tax=Bradyrhizobium sp. BWA-3-5 TaxID=3080013 RepID=UPI00293ED5E3|nr:acyl-homoserine-lactone synthase [Bradyrhizobium sp. BWA-3-5]WOH63676.1 acyl-homoserine-lactone synthase [Bradyrhizobium sp. BWA-3-5]
MHAVGLHAPQFGRNLELLASMYRLRRRVFKDRLDWSVSVSGEFELDVYDTLGPTYLILLSDGGEPVGSVRLLPTTGPTMLADAFPVLLGGTPAPQDKSILESSRFCVDTRLITEQVANSLNRATLILFAAMIEAARGSSADSIVTVTDTRMERILRRAGWPLRRIAAPQQVGSTTAVAGFLDTSEQALHRMYERADVSGPVLLSLDLVNAAA